MVNGWLNQLRDRVNRVDRKLEPQNMSTQSAALRSEAGLWEMGWAMWSGSVDEGVHSPLSSSGSLPHYNLSTIYAVQCCSNRKICRTTFISCAIKRTNCETPTNKSKGHEHLMSWIGMSLFLLDYVANESNKNGNCKASRFQTVLSSQISCYLNWNVDTEIASSPGCFLRVTCRKNDKARWRMAQNGDFIHSRKLFSDVQRPKCVYTWRFALELSYPACV